jgi:hypothetical protein
VNFEEAGAFAPAFFIFLKASTTRAAKFLERKPKSEKADW